MNEDRKKALEEYILKQLKNLGKTVSANYQGNQEARTRNPFLCFSDGVDKFMGLGRSIDAQLGNRMQNIIFYLCRVRYGANCVPNIVLVNTDSEKLSIELKMFYAEGDLTLEKFYANKNPCQQKIYFNQTFSIDDAKKKMWVKKKFDIVKEETLSFPTTIETINKIKKQKKEIWPVDLLFIDKKKTPQVITTFEIKMSGYIDTKNAESNANEVQRLFDAFNFSSNNESYFAVCYAECADTVKSKMAKNAPNGKIMTADEFWSTVLPNDRCNQLKYGEFITIYKRAFAASQIEKTIKEL